MGHIKLCRSVHIAPRQGQGPETIVSYCTNSVPCAGPCPRPGQCVYTITGNFPKTTKNSEYISQQKENFVVCYSWKLRVGCSFNLLTFTGIVQSTRVR